MTHPRARHDEIERETRRQRVANLLIAGTRDQSVIALRCGVDRSTISRDIKEIEARWRQQAAADIAAMKGQDAERIDWLIRSVWPAAESGDLAAVDRVIDLLKRRAAMFGYDAPDRIDVTGNSTSKIELVGVDAESI